MAISLFVPDSAPDFVYPTGTLVRYLRPINPTAQAIHGLTTEDTRHASPFPTAWQIILNYIDMKTTADERVLLVAHNARFDISFIRNELRRHSLPYPDWTVSCSLRVIRSVKPLLPRKLTTLAEYANVHPAYLNRAHRAKGDVRLLSAVIDYIAKDINISPSNIPFLFACQSHAFRTAFTSSST